MFKTTLQNIHEVDESDFGYGPHVYGLLLEAQAEELEVTVVQRVIDNGNPAHDNYDIVLDNGLKVDAVSGYHLADIHNFVENTHESQFCLAVQHGVDFDHGVWSERIESMLRDAEQNPHISISYETTYAISK